MVKGIEGLTEDERKALRGSKFAPLPSYTSSSSSSSLRRVAHPGGPVTTNKAVALVKFLERKLQEPGGLDSLKPELVELAVKNAKDTVNISMLTSEITAEALFLICSPGGTSTHGQIIQHVTSFDDHKGCSSKDWSTSEPNKRMKKEKKEKKQKMKKKKRKVIDQ